MMSDYLDTLVRPLLSQPDDLRIKETKDEMGLLLTMDIAKRDMGIIVGKEGSTARAIRHLLRNYGLKNQARVSVKINEPIDHGI